VLYDLCLSVCLLCLFLLLTLYGPCLPELNTMDGWNKTCAQFSAAFSSYFSCNYCCIGSVQYMHYEADSGNNSVFLNK